jgi:tryptophan halogenase
MKPVKEILIVGGGTAGWLTAAFLAKLLAGVRISLVESQDIGILGVGEGTFPSIRGTLSTIGIDEARFLRAANATFKQGVKFVNWVRPPGAAGADHYFHPFNVPSSRTDGLELLPYWLLGAAGPGVAFADAVTMQKRTADAFRAPKRRHDPDYRGPMNYAYHFDAVQFAALLRDVGKELGVVHHVATVEHVELDDEGAVAGVVTKERGRMTADLYVDCTGFRAALIGGGLGVPFTEIGDTLFVDRALAFQVPYERPDCPIASYTISTAQEAGWIWDIGLQQRRGVGYVYSSRYTDDARAEDVLRLYAGTQSEALTPRLLKFRVGYRKTQWVKNCVAVGLSAGFLEPLESSGIGLIESAAYLIGYLFPHDGNFAPLAQHFNAFMAARYERIIDFLKMHYCLTQRRDTPFWTDNAALASMPSSLKDKLAMWCERPPHRLDFLTDLEMYLPASWQFVLYGMEFRTDLGAAKQIFTRTEDARQEFRVIRQMSDRALGDLPLHRDLIEYALKGGATPATAEISGL